MVSTPEHSQAMRELEKMCYRRPKSGATRIFLWVDDLCLFGDEESAGSDALLLKEAVFVAKLKGKSSGIDIYSSYLADRWERVGFGLLVGEAAR